MPATSSTCWPAMAAGSRWTMTRGQTAGFPPTTLSRSTDFYRSPQKRGLVISKARHQSAFINVNIPADFARGSELNVGIALAGQQLSDADGCQTHRLPAAILGQMLLVVVAKVIQLGVRCRAYPATG